MTPLKTLPSLAVGNNFDNSLKGIAKYNVEGNKARDNDKFNTAACFRLLLP